MSRSTKILIFSLILIFSIYNKNVNGGFFDNFNNNSFKNPTKKTPKKNPIKKNPKKNSSTKSKKNKPSTPVSNQSNQFDIDSPDYTSVPKSGHSPYDAYFGKGFVFRADYSYNYYRDENVTLNEYRSGEADLSYNKDGSKWEFGVKAKFK